jgi:hypothetical protein
VEKSGYREDKRGLGITQVVEHLPDMHEALNSIPRISHTHTKSNYEKKGDTTYLKF